MKLVGGTAWWGTVDRQNQFKRTPVTPRCHTHMFESFLRWKSEGDKSVYDLGVRLIWHSHALRRLPKVTASEAFIHPRRSMYAIYYMII